MSQGQSTAPTAPLLGVSLLFHLAPWPRDRVERIQDACSKGLCSSTSFSTCRPCEIQPFLPPPHHSLPASCSPPPGLHGRPPRIPRPSCVHTSCPIPHPFHPGYMLLVTYNSPNRIHQKVLVLSQNLTSNKLLWLFFLSFRLRSLVQSPAP